MTLEEIKNRISGICEEYKDYLEFSYLFGSMAKGETAPSSDVDIALYFRHSIGKDRFFDLGLAVQSDMCRALKSDVVDVVILNTVANLMLLDEIVRHGIILFDGNEELREEFEVRALHRAMDFKEQRKYLVGV